jgi:hypothetical protein
MPGAKHVFMIGCKVPGSKAAALWILQADTLKISSSGTLTTQLHELSYV